jgi:DNA-binding transcriptional LysR family regulator
MTNWDNFRFVLAVARMGSALRAARALGVNQTTVVRRITQMEDSLGGILFERRQSGLQITSLGERTATAAARVESEIMALESALHAEQRMISGTVRFTCSESFANAAMVPRRCAQQQPVKSCLSIESRIERGDATLLYWRCRIRTQALPAAGRAIPRLG